jgi:N-methylhydantoinase A
VGALLAALDVPVSLSHNILNEFREFERTSTTLVNAYVSPVMNAYLKRLTRQIKTDNLRIMQSNGGSISAETAMRESVRTILSGPAGGVVGAYEIGKTAGFNHLITFDMGGTSTDVCLIEDALPMTTESTIAGYPVKVPMIDIHTVGAGGGSIAHGDAGGALKVGPESAGADPGPICFGKGRRITVTDANLFLGRLIADRFLGGGMSLDANRLNAAFEAMAERFHLTPVTLAEGILDIANTAMERAVRVISVEKGLDPKHFTLFSFGGAGGMHAVFLARMLHIPQVLIPRNPGILSAWGMLMSDIVKDYSRTVMLTGDDLLPADMAECFRPLEQQAVSELEAEGVHPSCMTILRSLDMRYRGQSHEIQVPFNAHMIEGFHRLHEKTYGYCRHQAPVEIVNVRLRAVGKMQKPSLEQDAFDQRSCASERAEAVVDERPVVFAGRTVMTPVMERERLPCGRKIIGPAIIVEYSSTVVLPPACTGRVDAYGNLIITVEEN